jgi:uncharacterized damage-inducible protein DinB
MWAQEWLRAAIEYDRWATLRWLDTYGRLPEPNQAEPVIQHVIWAVETWLSRVDPSFEPQACSLRVRLDQAAEGWLRAMESIPLESVIAYRNTANQPFERQFGAIAAHLVNHGTYHRGQLRAIADEHGFLDFPETDLLLFFMEQKLFGPCES